MKKQKFNTVINCQKEDLSYDMEIQEVEGTYWNPQIPELKDFKFFIRKEIQCYAFTGKELYNWIISECSTGHCISDEKTRKDAVHSATNKLLSTLTSRPKFIEIINIVKIKLAQDNITYPVNP